MRRVLSFLPPAWAALVCLALAACVSEPVVVLPPSARSADPLQEQISVDAALDGVKPTAGNKVTILRNGTETFPALFAAMAAARDTINLEYYIFEDVRSGGKGLGDLLLRKLGEGVAVNISYDGYGSLPTKPAFLDRLRQAGANLVIYHPINAADVVDPAKLNDRDHRKIMVIDGRVAFVGGVNLDKVYENPHWAGAIPGGDPATAFWRDTDARIDGPAVADLQRLFLEDWAHEKGPPLPQRSYFPRLDTPGTQVVRVIGSSPGEDRPLYYRAFLNAVHAARRSISLSTGFFTPTHQEREELERAARRGVAVRLVLPSVSGSPSALAVGRASYGDLLEAGVRIYEIQGAVLHSKLATVDGVWSTIGSSNLDLRSVVYNREVDAVVLGRETAAAVSLVLDDDVTHAREITLEAWERRSFTERKNEFMARFMAWLL